MATKNEAKITFKAETADFERSIKSANSSMSSLRAEAKLNEAQFQNTGDKVEYLKKKSENLKKQLEANKEKQEALNGKIESAKAIYGENSDEVKKLATQLTYTKTAEEKLKSELNSTEKELEEAADDTEKLADETKKAGDNAQNSKSKWSVFKGIVANLAASAISSLVSGLKRTGEYLLDLGFSAAAQADEINTLSTVTGLSTDTIQEFNYAAELMDVDINTVTSALKKNMSSMKSAKDGTGKAAEAYKKLGVNVTDADGNLRDSEEVFWDVIDALGDVADETERDSLAMDLFGRSANELNPLIEQGSAGFAELAEQARESGAVLSGDTLNALNDANDSIDTAKGKLNALTTTIGAAIAPALGAAADLLSGVFDGVSRAMQGPQDDMSLFKREIDAMLGNVRNLKAEADSIVSTTTDSDNKYAAYVQILEDMYDAEGNVIDGTKLDAYQKYMLKKAITELSKVCPELTGYYDDQTDSLNLTKQAMIDVTAEARRSAIAQAMIKAQGKYLEAYADAAVAAGMASAGLKHAQDELNSTSRETYEVQGRGNQVFEVSNGEYEEAAFKVNAWQEKVDEANEALETAESDLNECNEGLSAMAEEMGITTDELFGMAEATDEAADSTEGLGEQVEETAETVDEATQEIIDAYEGMVDSIRQGIKSAISHEKEWTETEGYSLDKIASNLKNQKDRISTWAEQMARLGELAGSGFSQEFYDYLVELGPDSWELVSALVDDLDTNGGAKLSAMASNFAEAMQISEGDAAELIASYTSEGKAMANAAASGVTAEKGKVSDAVDEMVEDAATDADTSDAEDLGEDITDKATTAVEESAYKVKDAVTDMASSAANAGGSSFTGMAKKIKDSMSVAKDDVVHYMRLIKDAVNVTLKPTVQLPRFHINGEFNLQQGRVPNIGLEWNYYAKGAVFSKPTLLNGNSVVGEAGKEAVAPISTLQSYVEDAVNNASVIDYARLGDAVAAAMATVNSDIVIDGRVLGRTIREMIN